jgi:hypothetical protein
MSTHAYASSRDSSPVSSPTSARTNLLQRKCACGGTSTVAEDCEGCKQKEHQLQRKAADHRTTNVSVPPIVNQVVRSSGQPLDAETRAFFEPRFGRGFSQVRVHNNSRAAESARAVNALAYTVGKNIVFDAGQYAPTTSDGRRTLAHELTHVAQQNEAPSQTSLRVGEANDSYEQEADKIAAKVIDQPGHGQSAGAGLLQSQPRLQRLGANPTCTRDEADGIHQAIFDARGWLNKAVPKLEEIPLSALVLASLRRNFGPTYGVAENATLIRDRLKVARSALGRIPFSCDTPGATALCAAQQCGWATIGSNAATICTNPPSTLSVAWPRAADCVLHESLHASMSFMTVDNYKVNPGYPGVGTEPLRNPESYTKLAMDLS